MSGSLESHSSTSTKSEGTSGSCSRNFHIRGLLYGWILDGVLAADAVASCISQWNGSEQKTPVYIRAVGGKCEKE